METVTVDYAETNLGRLLARVEAGEEIAIARGDQPVAVLSPHKPTPTVRRRPGSMRGLIDIGPEFLEPLPSEELDFWE